MSTYSLQPTNSSQSRKALFLRKESKSLPQENTAFSIRSKGTMLIFTILILPIHEHGIFIHLSMSSLISFTSVLSDQIRSVVQSCLTLCDPMNHSMPGLPVHHQPLEFTQTHIHQVGDAIQPSHPLSSPSPLAPNPSQHQSLFQ